MPDLADHIAKQLRTHFSSRDPVAMASLAESITFLVRFKFGLDVRSEQISFPVVRDAAKDSFVKHAAVVFHDGKGPGGNFIVVKSPWENSGFPGFVSQVNDLINRALSQIS